MLSTILVHHAPSSKYGTQAWRCLQIVRVNQTLFGDAGYENIIHLSPLSELQNQFLIRRGVGKRVTHCTPYVVQLPHIPRPGDYNVENVLCDPESL